MKDILARKGEERASVVARLSMLGWSQEEIGEAIGVTQRAAGQNLEGLSEPIKLLKSDLARGLDCTTVAERHALYLPYVWALKLEPRKPRTWVRSLSRCSGCGMLERTHAVR